MVKMGGFELGAGIVFGLNWYIVSNQALYCSTSFASVCHSPRLDGTRHDCRNGIPSPAALRFGLIESNFHVYNEASCSSTTNTLILPFRVSAQR